MLNFRLLLAIVVLCATVVRVQAAEPAPLGDLFHDDEAVAHMGTLPLAAWRDVLARTREELRTPDAMPRAWRDFVTGLAGLDFKGRLERANATLNRVPYVTAMRNWGDAWRWESPDEFIAHGGQCEDFAIAKYFALRGAGVAASQLRIVVVEDTVDHLVHAVLVANDAANAFVLDNRIDHVADAKSMQRYRPLYGFNETSWWHYAEAAGTERPAAR